MTSRMSVQIEKKSTLVSRARTPGPTLSGAKAPTLEARRLLLCTSLSLRCWWVRITGRVSSAPTMPGMKPCTAVAKLCLYEISLPPKKRKAAKKRSAMRR